LNFINSADSKRIYKPFDEPIIEIENSVLCEDNNIEQSKSLISKLFQMGLLPNKKLRMELIGVYRHACVININRHLKGFISEENLPIENWINEDFTI
jgi:Fe2+ transport system protein FeoA